MNQYVSYILNLSEQYNAGNYLYYFLPGIAGRKILLFEELTRNQFPTDDSNQEKELVKRIRKLKDHWQFYQLNPDNQIYNLKINIVIDSALWNFSGFGEYSRFPYVKLYVIKKFFEKFFTKQELEYINFQFFIIKNENNDIEELIAYIDEKKGMLHNERSVELGEIDTALLNWPTYTDIQSLVEKTYNVEGKVTEAIIEDKLLAEFETDILEITQIIASKMKTEENSEKYHQFIQNRFAYLLQMFSEQIVKIKDLNNAPKKKKIITNFFKIFSSANYLRKNKDLLLRFSIDIQSARSKINGFEALTALLVESVDFFKQKSHIDFLSGGGSDKLIFDVMNVEFDEEMKQELFEDYSLFSHEKESLEKLYTEKRMTKHFHFNDEINPKEYFQIDEKEINKFTYIDYIDKEIKYFYSKQTIENAKLKLQNNTIDELENSIQQQLEKINTSHLLEGNYGVGTNSQEMSFKEIEFQLQKLKGEEKHDKILSEVDYQVYKQAQSNYKKDIKPLHQAFINSINLLPYANKTVMIIALSVLLLFLFFAPVYYFDYWKEAISYAFILIIFLIIGGFLVINMVRNEIINRYKDISARNISLIRAFRHYVETLKTLAEHIRESTLRRMNIKALEKVYEMFSKEANQIKIYKQFYSGIITQLERNGYHIQKTQKIVQKPDYSSPPFLDYRIKKEREMNSFIIKNNMSSRSYPEENKKFVSVLGIITKIEIK